jgi:hypothetical protein
MSLNTTLTKKNIINATNNKFKHKFPSQATFKKGDTIALSQLAINFSWFNITSKYRNNFFQYKWWDENSELQTYDVHIADGYYSIATLYEYFQSVLVKNKHYLVNPEGDFVHFFELKSSATYYSVYFRLHSMNKMMTFGGVQYDITTSTDYHIPGTWLPPMNENEYETPQLIIPSNNNFGLFVGFEPQTLLYIVVGDTENTKYDLYSDKVPVLDPSSSFIVTCNMVNNHLSEIDNILYTFSISGADVSFGDTVLPIKERIDALINPGSYSEIIIEILDENYLPLNIIDPATSLTISITEK